MGEWRRKAEGSLSIAAEAYKAFLKSDATVVLSSQSDLFRYLANPAGVAQSR